MNHRIAVTDKRLLDVFSMSIDVGRLRDQVKRQLLDAEFAIIRWLLGYVLLVQVKRGIVGWIHGPVLDADPGAKHSGYLRKEDWGILGAYYALPGTQKYQDWAYHYYTCLTCAFSQFLCARIFGLRTHTTHKTIQGTLVVSLF